MTSVGAHGRTDGRTDRRTDTESRIIQAKGLESFTRFLSLLVFVFELCRRIPRIYNIYTNYYNAFTLMYVAGVQMNDHAVV